jgi:hypothetical protein
VTGRTTEGISQINCQSKPLFLSQEPTKSSTAHVHVERFCDREHRLRLISAIRSFARPAGKGRRRGTEQRHRTRSYARLIFQILRCDLSDNPTAFRTTTIKEIAMANRQNMESPMRTKKTYLKIEISIATTSTYLNASKTGLHTPPRVRFLRSQGSTANSQSSCF